MVRLIGIILLIAGSSGVAYSYCFEQNERIRILICMREIFVRIKKEIEYLKISIPEICHNLSLSNIVFNETFKRIHQEIELNNGRSFNEIWYTHFMDRMKKAPLSEQEKEILIKFPESLVYRYSEGQAEGISKYIDEVSKHISELEAVTKNKNKVVMCMGVMAGMIAVVILF